ncbi:hypothetical protein ThrDRAFT_02050 [Frankia casuarinae]|jgi:hypothetical protein|nr:hypothetical protein ThrDRAFT_02050 [Frankia casuarinae]
MTTHPVHPVHEERSSQRTIIRRDSPMGLAVDLSVGLAVAGPTTPYQVTTSRRPPPPGAR